MNAYEDLRYQHKHVFRLFSLQKILNRFHGFSGGAVHDAAIAFELVNDFEAPIIALYPRIGEIKDQLYADGALYAQMSGSGSAVFGIFANHPTGIAEQFGDCFTAVMEL